MAGRSDKRTVAGTIDAGGVYSSRLASGGGWVFLSGVALDDSGRLAGDARAAAPYERSEPARAHAQTRAMMGQLRDLLPKLGSSLAGILQLEQYVGLKVHTDPYFQVALGPGFMDKDKPTGATAAIAGFFPEDAVVSITGIAMAPDEASGFIKEYPGDEDPAKRATRKFADVTAAGPYGFTTYFASDNKTGVHPSARLEAWTWLGSEIRSEAEYGVQLIKDKLAKVGASLADVVNYTVFLADPDDLYEFDLVFGPAFGDMPPSRTVIPSTGFANPRREKAFGHEENAQRMEAQFRFLRPGHGAEKVLVKGPGDGFGNQSAGVRAGSLLWLSSQYADPKDLEGPAARQVAGIFEKLATVCRNGGTDLTNLLRIRAIVTTPDDALAVFAALKKAVPKDPPVVSILVAPRLPVQGALVTIDGVAYVEGA